MNSITCFLHCLCLDMLSRVTAAQLRCLFSVHYLFPPSLFSQMIRIITGVLVSLAFSSGMTIDQKGFLVPPLPGSPDSPIPPDDYFDDSAAINNHIPIFAYDNYQIAKDSLNGYPLPMLPILPDRYPILPKPPFGNTTQGSRTVPTGQKPDLSYCDMLLEASVPPPVDQTPWFCVCSHCKGGPSGPKGDKGDRGLPGY